MAEARAKSPLRIAVDTGGTFTDFVWSERGRLRTLKLFSTREDPSLAIVEGVQKIAGERAAVVVLHGTTVGTNALLERKGARTALVTTAGFEDAIEIGRQARPRLYDLMVTRPDPLVPQELRFGVEERTQPDAKIERAPQPAALRHIADQVVAKSAEAVALCLLFSFANPENEQRVAEALKATGLPLSLSYQLLPEFREYERMSTVVVNAYLQPLMQRYLAALGDRLKQGAARSQVFVMQSSGGITPLATASAEPVRTVLSGPAGGAIGALRMAARSGSQRIISFDMGGTSTDVALLDGKAQTTNEAEVAGLPVRVPMLNIHTVGAGGGSLARFDAGGALRVGPESAGANPGPICYGRGTQPTVTDANLLLGRLQPEGFLGGGFALDAERARRVTAEWLAREAPGLRWKPEQLAEGMIRVVNATMEKAIRVVSIEQGYDPREFALVAFGGAGPLHACELAAALAIPTVIVPAMPGALSAYGILISDVVKDLSRTVLMQAGGKHAAAAERIYRELEATVLRQLKSEGWQGRPRLERSVDMRYAGQGFELNVAWSKRAVADFHAAHQRKYGYAHTSKTVEAVNLRLRAVLPQPREAVQPERESAAPPPRKGRVSVIARAALAGTRRSGPAVITEYSATTWVPAGTSFHLDRSGNLVLTIPRPKPGQK